MSEQGREGRREGVVTLGQRQADRCWQKKTKTYFSGILGIPTSETNNRYFQIKERHCSQTWPLCTRSAEKLPLCTQIPCRQNGDNNIACLPNLYKALTRGSSTYSRCSIVFLFNSLAIIRP